MISLNKIIILFSIALYIGCSSKQKAPDSKQETSKITTTPIAPVPVQSPTPPENSAQKAETQPEIKPAQAPENKSQAEHEQIKEIKESIKKAEEIVKKDDHPERKVGAVPFDKALGWLKNGNIRFQKGYFRKDGASKKDVERLSKGQNPHSIILSCSDSRVPPEVVFDQKLGEIFVVRTAGESLDNSSIASIEYAVEHLGSNLIVVMGHSSCGAVRASFETPVGGDTGSPYINALVADIQPRIAERMKSAPSENFTTESWDNTRGVALKLMEKSKIIQDAVKSGSLRIETALYIMKSGQVEWSSK